MVAVWFIWNEGNRKCFEVVSTYDSQVVDKVKYLVALWSSALPQFQAFFLSMILHNWKGVAFSYPMALSINPSWSAPPLGSLKLNFDGNLSGNPGRAGVVGVTCNNEGSVVLAYFGPAGFFSINKAELLRLLISLREARQFNFQHLCIEGDSFCVVQWAAEKANPPWY